jgi:hypothetical protein
VLIELNYDRVNYQAGSFDALSEKSMVVCKLISGSELLYRFGIWNPIDPVASGLCIRTVSTVLRWTIL